MLNKLRPDGFPRRSDLTLLTPVERKLFDFISDDIEALPAHPLQTEVVILLQQARDKLADFFERDEANVNQLASDAVQPVEPVRGQV